ncbi:MAG: methyl-accepting chemotaxis protein [Ectothiorhodospiraceae bacterium]|nr:methyl-accepting chemotaxis protein [Ectothiorhodospiraceae bacterium]
MLNNLKISTRLYLGFGGILVLTLTLLIPAVLGKISELSYDAEQQELVELFESAHEKLVSEERMAESLSLMVATLGSVQRLFAAGDREGLAEIMMPVFTKMKADFSVRQFQFHTPPATSFLRLHNLAKFGDDLSSFRQTVVIANRNKKHIYGLEKGSAGLGIRGVSPVFYQGNHIGSVEFGMSFGQQFFEDFKKTYGTDIALYVQREGKFEAFGSTHNDIFLTNEQLSQAQNGTKQTLQTVVEGKPLAIYAAAIVDFSGQPIGVLEIAMDRSHNQAIINDARALTLFIGALALVIGILIALYISHSITKPLKQTTAAMNDIAQGEGDLTRRLKSTGRDEIAELGSAFNRFAEKVQDMVRQVSGSTTQLASAAEQMSVITDETHQGVQDQHAQIEEVATAINEMAATAQEVATSAASAAEAAHNADDESNQGRRVVQETIDTIDSLATDIGKAVGVINQLEENSDNIGGVLDVIRGIAEQTNLLALNAAIEAARAGEQGRGFAVVADEVRTLAHRTQESTQEIQSMIESLQQGARNAVEVMNQSNERTQLCVEKAASAGTSLTSITSSVNQINEMNLQIATAAEEQTSVAEEINRNVLQINTLVEGTAAGARQTSSASVELTTLASELQTLIRQFKI